jgi:hypothetical protein
VQIKAVPRWHGTTEFRSTLEASWARTFDHYGISWEYEPKYFTLPSGRAYLPDFHLPELGTWMEVKGDDVPRTDKAAELAGMLTCRCTGACQCEWPHGELVILGRAPRSAIRCDMEELAVILGTDYRPHGRRDAEFRMSWDSLVATTRLAHCDRCDSNSWIPLKRPFCCRKCKEEISPAHLAAPGDKLFLAVTSRGTVVG